MGTDKARLVRPGESEPLLERTCRLTQQATGIAPLIAGRERPTDWSASLDAVRSVPDERPDAGPLAGLGAGLRVADAEAHDAVLLLPCDLPFLTIDALTWLLHAAEGEMGNGMVARQGEQIEPLFAVYRTKLCLPPVEARLAAGQRSPLRWINEGGFSFAEIPLLLLPNLRDADTPADWSVG